MSRKKFETVGHSSRNADFPETDMRNSEENSVILHLGNGQAFQPLSITSHAQVVTAPLRSCSDVNANAARARARTYRPYIPRQRNPAKFIHRLRSAS